MKGEAMTAPVSARPRPGQDEAQPQRPAEPGRPPATLRPWTVGALWAAMLGLLVAMDAGFGNSTFVLEVSGSSAGFVFLLAGAVWLDRRLRPDRGYLRYPTRIGGGGLPPPAGSPGGGRLPLCAGGPPISRRSLLAPRRAARAGRP